MYLLYVILKAPHTLFYKNIYHCGCDVEQNLWTLQVALFLIQKSLSNRYFLHIIHNPK